MRKPILLALCSLLLSSVALADDVTMTNGKVYKDLTLVKETKTAYIYLTHAGRRMTLSKKSVQKVEPKPTVRGELQERLKKVGRRDADALADLGVWADGKGMGKDAKSILRKALSVDRDHVKAHEALGDRMLKGKWVREAVWKKARAKELEKQYAAWGWEQSNGEWVPGTVAHRADKQYVQVQGHWVDPKTAKKIAAKNLSFAEGAWLEPDEKAKFDEGLRKHGKRWLSIEDLDEVHVDFQDPWIVETVHFEIHSNAKHKDTLWVSRLAEIFYKPLQEIFGEEHRDLYAKGKGKIVLNVGRGVKSYNFLGGTYGHSNRTAHKSSGYGAFYAPAWGEGRGAGCTYVHGDRNWVEVWVANVVTHAFIARMAPRYEDTHEKTLEALSGYIAGFSKEGIYHPTRWFHWRYLDSATERPIGRATTTFDRIGYRTEHTLQQAGFVLHFLRSKNEKAFTDYWRTYVTKGADDAALLAACFGDGQAVDKDQLDAEFGAFLKDHKAKFKPAPNRQ
ncbi:MAG: hypothetical protein CMJ90_11245 [Planctomycetes bacterium]|nr:hypothetical protein [Planctomycetota bacterium]